MQVCLASFDLIYFKLSIMYEQNRSIRGIKVIKDSINYSWIQFVYCNPLCFSMNVISIRQN